MNDARTGEPQVFVVRDEGLVPADRASEEVGTLGMRIFLASLSMLFIASVIGYLMTRLRAEAWPPDGTPPMPGGLWASTWVLMLSSATIQLAVRSARLDRSRAVGPWMLVTTLLGLMFLALQGFNWWKMGWFGFPDQAKLYAFTFYMLTGLHALHVIGGLGFLSLVTVRAFRGGYWSLHHAGVRHAAAYWHFLDGVWLILFILLVFV